MSHSFPYPPSKTARHSHHTQHAERSARNASSATEHCHTEATASARFKAWLPIDLLTGQMVNVRRSDGSWQTGIVNGVRSDAADPHLIIRFLDRKWKRVLVSEIEANVRPHAGQEINEISFEPAGATPPRGCDLHRSDNEFSDTELARACDMIQSSRGAHGMLQSRQES